jgi:hypothetical protein
VAHSGLHARKPASRGGRVGGSGGARRTLQCKGGRYLAVQYSRGLHPRHAPHAIALPFRRCYSYIKPVLSS